MPLDNRGVMRLLAGLIFNYLSWTQLVPMRYGTRIWLAADQAGGAAC